MLYTLWVLWLTSTDQRHASDSKLLTGVNVSVCGGLSLYVSRVMNCLGGTDFIVNYNQASLIFYNVRSYLYDYIMLPL